MQTREHPSLPIETLGGIDFRVLPDEAVRTVVTGLLGDVRDLQAEISRLRHALASAAH